MKKQNKRSAPWWKLHSGLVIVLAVAVIALAVLSIFRFPAAGQATGLVRVCDDVTDEDNALDLDANARLQLDVAQVESCLLLFTSSEEGADQEYYVLTATSNGDGILQYILERQDRSARLALGLLGPQLADTRGILINTEDAVPDIEFHYANGLLEVVNLGAVEAPRTGITGKLHLLKGTRELDKLLFTGLAQVPVAYTLEVDVVDALGAQITNRDITPELKINNQVIATVNASSLRTGTKNVFDFVWTPTAVGLHNFTVMAKVQNDPTNLSVQKSYDVGVDGIIYQLSNDANYPEITLKLRNELTREAQARYVFQNVADKQPFSVPCTGVTPLDSLQLVPVPEAGSVPPTTPTTAGSVVEVFGYDAQRQEVQGWRGDAPSEFAQLVPHRGYSLKLKDPSTKWMFTLTCTLPEQPELPSLIRGWNLVSIAGHKAIAVTELAAKKAPPGTTIAHAKELQRNDVTSSSDVTSLAPGKAYWVLVQ